MAGLVPAIHVFMNQKAWMPGPRPGMTSLPALPLQFKTFRAQRGIWNRISKSRDKTARIHRCGPMLICYRIENISLK
jgi:hypothetical protein